MQNNFENVNLIAGNVESVESVKFIEDNAESIENVRLTAGNTEANKNVVFVTGNAKTLEYMNNLPAFRVFDDRIIRYLGIVSGLLLSDAQAKKYPDVITFGFWCRKAALLKLKNQYYMEHNWEEQNLVEESQEELNPVEQSQEEKYCTEENRIEKNSGEQNKKEQDLNEQDLNEKNLKEQDLKEQDLKKQDLKEQDLKKQNQKEQDLKKQNQKKQKRLEFNSWKQYRIGRGIVFHIAPSNVPVNFAYSLAAGLLAGNANIIRLPSGNFEQVRIICNALDKALTDELRPYLCLLQYGHDQAITNRLSSLCDTRIIWGGDRTIELIRQSPLRARSNEITFADRYSICVIDAGEYLKAENKRIIAERFYNDTYLTDQNACTSPRIVIWLGSPKENARRLFWGGLREVAQNHYELHPIQAVNKYLKLCMLAASGQPVHRIQEEDNYLVRIKTDQLNENMIPYCGSFGSFIEYEAEKIDDILPVCSSKCQTLSYYGLDKEDIGHFIMNHRPKGIDRAVPIGKTLDFSLIWDGYDLVTTMSRAITM